MELACSRGGDVSVVSTSKKQDWVRAFLEVRLEAVFLSFAVSMQIQITCFLYFYLYIYIVECGSNIVDLNINILFSAEHSIMAASVRHRVVDHAKKTQDSSNSYARGPDSSSKSKQHLRPPVWLLIFAFHALILLFIHCRNQQFPDPVAVSSAKPGQFVEERARRHLSNITSFGERPTGSYANEVLVVKYLLDALEIIRSKAKLRHTIEIDSSRVSGTFTYDHVQLGGFASVYQNVNNIAVKLSPRESKSQESRKSLLVNCHYDSVSDSEG